MVLVLASLSLKGAGCMRASRAAAVLKAHAAFLMYVVCVLQVWDRSARHMLDVTETAFRYSPGTF